MFYTRKRNSGTRSRRSRSKSMTMKKIHGGVVIGSGGFSCVLKPALPGLDDVSDGKLTEEFKEARENRISKVFAKESQEEEYRLITSFRDKLQSVPGFHDHFLLEHVTLSKPAFDYIDEKDWEGFEERCTKNPKMFHVPRTEAEKKEASMNLRLLNMPDGGTEVGKYFDANFSLPLFHELKRDFASLVKTAIIPMNKKGVYHSDIRSANLLFSEEHVRIIDWGLAKQGKGYNVNKYRSLSKNLHASCLMLTTKFETAFNENLLPLLMLNKRKKKENPNTKTKNENEFLRKRFLLDYFVTTKDFERRIDVITGLTKLYSILEFKQPRVVLPHSDFAGIADGMFETHEETMNILLEQQSSVLRNRSNYDLKRKRLDMEKYYNNVYRRNIDLFGAASVMAELSKVIHNHEKEEEDTKNVKGMHSAWKVGQQLYLYAIQCCDHPISHKKFLKILESGAKRHTKKRLLDVEAHSSSDTN